MAKAECPECKHPVPDGAASCPGCGLALPGAAGSLEPEKLDAAEGYDTATLIERACICVAMVATLILAFYNYSEFRDRLAKATGAAMCACFMVVLYMYWRGIPEGSRRISPKVAVIFMFVPIFNLYWCFVAFCALAEDANRCLAGRSGKTRAPKWLAVALSVWTAAKLALLYGEIGVRIITGNSLLGGKMPNVVLVLLIMDCVILISFIHDIGGAIRLIGRKDSPQEGTGG
jgi:hypothetical protein